MIEYFNTQIKPLNDELGQMLGTTQLASSTKIRKIYVKYEPGEEDWEFTRHSDGVMTWLAVF